MPCSSRLQWSSHRPSPGGQQRDRSIRRRGVVGGDPRRFRARSPHCTEIPIGPWPFPQGAPIDSVENGRMKSAVADVNSLTAVGYTSATRRLHRRFERLAGASATSRAGERQQRSPHGLRDLAATRRHTKRVDGRSFPRHACPTWDRDSCHCPEARQVGTLEASRGSSAET